MRLELGFRVVAAADLAVAAVGTETDGSIVCPSGANGVVGIKPTLGLWSRAGVIPISADQDTAGPMARNVTDAAVLLGAATGVDPNDVATADHTARLHRLHALPRCKCARRRPNRRLARRHVRPGVRVPGRRADPRRHDRRARGRRRDRDRRTDIDLSATDDEFPALLASSRPTSRVTSRPTSTARTRCRARRTRKRSPS